MDVDAPLALRLLHGASVLLIVCAGVVDICGAGRRMVAELDRRGLFVGAASVLFAARVLRPRCFTAFHGSGTRLSLRTAYC